jgi:nitrogen fixation protein FixH
MNCCGGDLMPTEWVERPKGSAEAGTIRGGHVLLMFVAFFAVVAAVNAVMVTSALRSMSGLDARNGYDPSQRYNADIAAARAQTERGTRADLTLAGSGSERSVLLLLSDRDGTPLDGLTIEAAFQHPGTKARDIIVPLTGQGAGGYMGASAGILAGAWTLVLTASDRSGAVVFRSRQRVLLKG